MMKKIFLTFVLLTAFSIGSKAQTYYVQSESKDISSSWTSVLAGNRMTQLSGTNRYYLVKQLTIASDDTTIPFRVRRTAGSPLGYITYDGYKGTTATATSGAEMYTQNATLHFEEAGTYWVIFTIDHGTDTSLDAVVMAHISADSNHGTTPMWTEKAMTFNSSDNKFHKKIEVYATAATTAKFKGLVYHRKTDIEKTGTEIIINPKSYGDAGVGGGEDISVSFPETGHYEVDFVLDPISKTAPVASIQGYHDITIGAYGYTTFSYYKVVDIPSSSTVFYITGQNSDGKFIVETETDKIPKTTTTPEKGTGVIFVGVVGSTHRLYWSADQTTPVTLTGNLLYGTGSTMHTVRAGDTYVFANKDGNIGFYLGKEGIFAANKAFLMASDVTGGSSPVREYYPISFGEPETTAIENVRKGLPANNQYYNLQGQPVSHPTKGIYILNGKKVMKR